MNVTRISILLMLLLPVMVALGAVVQTLRWRAAVEALHLRWEREQRQSAVVGMSLGQRQLVQTRFEELVSARAGTLIAVNVALTVVLAGIALAAAWEFDDLAWSGLWLVAPFGVVAVALHLFALFLLRGGHQQLAVTSTSLYGPPPPRVKLRNIQVGDATDLG